MNLYLVERRHAVRAGQRSAMVVRARDADDALALAALNAGREGCEAWGRRRADASRLSAAGDREVLLASTRASGAAAGDRAAGKRPAPTRRGFLAWAARAVAGGGRAC